MLKVKPLESINDLEPKLQKAIHSIPTNSRYYIALSGGLDSVALAYFCLPYLKEKTNDIQAIHINHGLSRNAQKWADFCQEFCDKLGIVCHVENVSVVNVGDGIEASARKARYKVFNHYLEKGGVLLQGHHLNDQAETVLMRFFRGSGPGLLKGIPQKREMSNGLLYRPWLHLPREVLKASAVSSSLSWVEDESNQDVRFERNYLRKVVLPIVQKRQSSIFYDLARAATKSQEASDFIYEWCCQQQKTFLSAYYSEEKAIDISNLKKYSNRQKPFILRYWFDLLGVSHPTERNFQRILKDLLDAGPDTKAEVSWKGHTVRCFDNALFCVSAALKAESEFSVEFDLPSNAEQSVEVLLPNGRLIVSSYDLGAGADKLTFQGLISGKKNDFYEVYCSIPFECQALSVRSRKGGDKIYLQSTHSSSLKKLYQSQKILPWHRDKLPLVFYNDTLIASLAGFVAQDFQIKPSSRHFSFRFELA